MRHDEGDYMVSQVIHAKAYAKAIVAYFQFDIFLKHSLGFKLLFELMGVFH